MIAALLIATASAGGLHLDRVELLSTDPGIWLNYDLPALAARPTTTAIRFVTQVQPVVALPAQGWHVGASIVSQSVSFEQPFGEGPVGWAAGVQAALLLPRGVFAEATADLGPVRLGLGGSLLSQATWTRLGGYSRWDPMLGVTVGLLTRKGRAP